MTTECDMICVYGKDNFVKNKTKTYEKILNKHIQEIAFAVTYTIGKEVPKKVEGMPYARQYVLEKVIEQLQKVV